MLWHYSCGESISFKLIWSRYTPLKQAAGQSGGCEAFGIHSDENRWFYDPKTGSRKTFPRHLHTAEDHYTSTKRNLMGWLKTHTRWSLQTEILVNTTDHEQETKTPCVVHSGTKNTHIVHSSLCVWAARGVCVCLPSVGVVESAPSSVAVASAEVRGYMLRLAGKNNTSLSTTSTADVHYQPKGLVNTIFEWGKRGTPLYWM